MINLKEAKSTKLSEIINYTDNRNSNIHNSYNNNFTCIDILSYVTGNDTLSYICSLNSPTFIEFKTL